MKRALHIAVLGLALLLNGGCVSVAAYQKARLNDDEMRTSQRPVEAYESTIETYREGASGGNGGKTGGGCGCN